MKQYIDIFRNLLRVAGRQRRLNFLMFASSGAYNFAGLLPPFAAAGIIKMITEEDLTGIWIYAGMYAGFYILYFGFLRINYYAYLKMAEFYHIGLQERMFKKIEQYPELLKKVPQGRVIDTFADDIRWVVDGVNVSVEAFFQFVRLLIIFVIFLSQDLMIGSIAVLVDVMYLLLLNDNAKEEAKRYANTRKAEDKVIGAFTEMINIKAEAIEEGSERTDEFEATSKEFVDAVGNFEMDEQWAKMEKTFPSWRREYQKRRQAIARRNTLWAGIPYAGKVILYILLAKMVIDGKMGLDVLVLIIGYFEMTITCMDKMTTHLLALSNYGVRVERIRKLL
ncbi:ABC transporter ATP-binding protein [Candidatus Saccharibacteria bacterium]|nr:ABC transporter ATP-binding protein [Candidatus Saccharibacteria bacterium]